MARPLLSTRNAILGAWYKGFLRKILFYVDPEKTHDLATSGGNFLGKFDFTRKLTRLMFNSKHKGLQQEVLGTTFKNPIGLAGGFDKNAKLIDIMPSIGFGFQEIGSVTGEPCKGNPKPRLWRLKKSKGLVVYYGLKNDGCISIGSRIWKKSSKVPLGTNIAKTNSSKTDDLKQGIRDYIKAYEALKDIGHFFVINISCPNVSEGKPFTKPSALDRLLKEFDKIKTSKPTFIKLPPDLKHEHIDEILRVVKKHKIHGFVCSNLTDNRKIMAIKENKVPVHGGISGKPVKELSTSLIEYIYKRTKGKYVIIGTGGVFTADDAYEKIKAGATLVELLTSMIFEGPQVVSDIKIGLERLLRRDGFTHISEAIGTSN